jgi:transketolase
MSAADLLAVLVARHLRYDWDSPELAANDHLIFSKGHASPLLYSVYKAVGVVSEDELLSGYRRFGQRLEGHPTPVLPWVDVATGSLGQGLPDAVGVCLAGKYLDRLPYRAWVLCGDSELAEGSVWEALDMASYYQLSNLVILVDVNRLGQRGETDLGWNLAAYQRRFEAFGTRVTAIDGHDLNEIDTAFSLAEAALGTSQPTVVLAKTVKGKGFSEIEDQDGWHGRALPADMAKRAIAELGGVRSRVIRSQLPLGPGPAWHGHVTPARPASLSPMPEPPAYTRGEAVATRKAYGDALAVLGACDNLVVVLDGEVINSTHADQFARAFPERYFEMFIAEQQLVAAATGLAVRGYKAFASTFAAFLTRAHDFIRMGAVSGVDLRLIGSHAGVEVGADGPSQMGLEDLAMMRAVHGATVLYPSDATSAAALVTEMASMRGISYMRTTRGAYPVLYPEEAALFGVLGSFVLLLLTDYNGPRRARLQSYLGLSVASSALVAIGTACSEHLWVSVAAATVIPFLVLLGGVVSSIMASSATPLVSATVLPVLISGPPGAIGDRLAADDLEASRRALVGVALARSRIPDGRWSGDSTPAAVVRAIEPTLGGSGVAALVADVTRYVADEVRDRGRSWWERVTGVSSAAPTTRIRAIRDRVGAHLSVDSVRLQGAVRGAVAFGGSVLIAKQVHVEHAFWVSFGTLAVLRTTAVGAGATAFRALAGTVAGVLVGTGAHRRRRAGRARGLGPPAARDSLYRCGPSAVLRGQSGRVHRGPAAPVRHHQSRGLGDRHRPRQGHGPGVRRRRCCWRAVLATRCERYAAPRARCWPALVGHVPAGNAGLRPVALRQRHWRDPAAGRRQGTRRRRGPQARRRVPAVQHRARGKAGCRGPRLGPSGHRSVLAEHRRRRL